LNLDATAEKSYAILRPILILPFYYLHLLKSELFLLDFEFLHFTNNFLECSRHKIWFFWGAIVPFHVLEEAQEQRIYSHCIYSEEWLGYEIGPNDNKYSWCSWIVERWNGISYLPNVVWAVIVTIYSLHMANISLLFVKSWNQIQITIRARFKDFYLNTKYDVTPIPTTITSWLKSNRKFTMLLSTITLTMFLISKQNASFADTQKFVLFIAHMM